MGTRVVISPAGFMEVTTNQKMGSKVRIITTAIIMKLPVKKANFFIFIIVTYFVVTKSDLKRNVAIVETIIRSM